MNANSYTLEFSKIKMPIIVAAAVKKTSLGELRKFIRDETVDLCYIDPPFNSKRNYNQIYNNIGTCDPPTPTKASDGVAVAFLDNIMYVLIIRNDSA